MDIMPDTHTILDALIPGRPGHDVAKACLTPDEQNHPRLWISASAVEGLRKAIVAEGAKSGFDESHGTALFTDYLSRVSIFSVTAASARDCIGDGRIGSELAFRNFKRIAPQGIIISNGGAFHGYPDTYFPEAFLALDEKLPSRTVPMLDLQEEYRYMLEDVDEAVHRCVADTRYILGPAVAALEKSVAQVLGVRHCIGVSSGTDALVLVLRALAIKTKGQEYFDRTDEIITSPLTFTATGDAILRSGATPVFIDIDDSTFNINQERIREYVDAEGTRAVGIIPVHLYGRACSMDKIQDVARANDLFILEDVAQAYGGTWKGRRLGSLGDAGAFSFFPSKNLGSFGDGGMVSTDDDTLAELVKMLLRHGGKDKYNVEHIGYNARLDTLQAAVVLAKLKYVDEFNGRRRTIAKLYAKGLNHLDGVVLPDVDAGHAVHQYTIRVQNKRRNALQKHLQTRGIGSMVYYPVPLHRMKVFEGRMKTGQSLDIAESTCEEVLSLPVEPLQTEKTTKYVIQVIQDFFRDESAC